MTEQPIHSRLDWTTCEAVFMVSEDPDSPKAAEAPEPETAEVEESDDDVRRKFRESLDRKRHQHKEQLDSGSGKASQKIQDGLAPTTGRRSFRRKSG